MVQQAVRSRIEETNAEFGAAASRGDMAAVAALYTDDAIVLPPNAEMVRGKQAIKGFFDGLVAQMGVPELTLATQQVEEIGDTACEIGAYTLKMRPPGGEPITDIGKYVVVWKRQPDDSWKLAVDIWNTNSPLPTP
ncbi:MAG TPA: SgcJ/EcaC family oxidoreductase [Dehalococcoidia bacterium]|jgi:uncharacterized protein (TIGR02246 family)|nr:SgcJ/EcaC family oxidoreductase [Dehalococcoidia bacterium]